MDTPGHSKTSPGSPDGLTVRTKFAHSLDAFRREIGALRQELIDAGQVAVADDESSYVMATKIDLLVNKMLHLQQYGNSRL